MKNLPVKAGVVRSGEGTLASPWQEGEGTQGTRTRATHNTRRPLPAQPNPRPYGYEGASEGVSHHTSPRGRPRSSLPMFVCYMRNK